MQLEFSSVRKECIKSGFIPVGIPAKLSSVCQLEPCLYVTFHNSLTKTLSYCSPAFDCKIRKYLFPNLSFAALFHVEYSSYDSLVWHTRVFYLAVLIEHIIDWNIQTRLSGECPRIHGVRLSVAYSTVLCARTVL